VSGISTRSWPGRLWGAARRDGTEAGQALVIVLVVVLLLIFASAVATTAITRSAVLERLGTDRQLSRQAVYSGTAAFYAALESDPAFNAPTLPPGCHASYPSSCANVFPESGPGQLFYGYSGGSVQVSGGTLVPCPSPAATCVTFSDELQPEPDSPPGYSLFAVSLIVTARSNCQAGGTCGYARGVERFVPRQFLSYLQFTGSELLDPALAAQSGTPYGTWYADCTTTASGAAAPVPDAVAATGPHASVCVVPAYLGPSASYPGDVLSGPVGTDDSVVYVCGAGTAEPVFQGAEPQATGSPPTAQYPAPGDCTSAPNGATPAGQTVPASPLPVSTSPLASVAAAADSYPASCGTLTVVLNGTATPPTYSAQCGSASPATMAWPANGVIYAGSNVSVQGTACQPVTVASAGTVMVTGNLTYATGCPAAVIGLVAGNAVVVVPSTSGGQITCWPNPVASQCMTVDAAVMALGAGDLPQPGSGTPAGGSFYLAGWNTATPPSCASGIVCALVFYGSVTEQYRGSFGTYSAYPSGPAPRSGIAKQFIFDARLVHDQPPYFLEPTTGLWERTGTTYITSGS